MGSVYTYGLTLSQVSFDTFGPHTTGALLLGVWSTEPSALQCHKPGKNGVERGMTG